LASNVQYKNIFAMIFNEIKCHVNTSLGLVGGMQGMHSPCVRAWLSRFVWRVFHLKCYT